jgi:hypothetical protein
VSDNFPKKTAATAGPGAESLLLPEWAFVVQFRTETAIEQGHYAGRVEHVVSGQATAFHSLNELLGFIARVLATVRYGEAAPVDQRTVVFAPVADPITKDRGWFGHALS